MSTRFSPLLAATIGAAALILTACGSTKSSPPVTGLGSETPSATATATVTPTPTPSQTVAAGGPCDAKHVKVTTSTSDGAAGTQVQRFVLTNTGTSPCHVNGHPFISLFGLQKQGSSQVEANLDITVDPIPAGFGDLGDDSGQINLATGDTAAFFIKWTGEPVGDKPCAKADGFDFRPPQDPSTDDNLLVDFTFSPCGDEVQVSQIFPPSITD